MRFWYEVWCAMSGCLLRNNHSVASRPNLLRRLKICLNLSERDTSYPPYRVLARLWFVLVLEYSKRRSRRLRRSTRPQRAVETKREPQLRRWLQLVAFEPNLLHFNLLFSGLRAFLPVTGDTKPGSPDWRGWNFYNIFFKKKTWPLFKPAVILSLCVPVNHEGLAGGETACIRRCEIMRLQSGEEARNFYARTYSCMYCCFLTGREIHWWYTSYNIRGIYSTTW